MTSQVTTWVAGAGAVWGGYLVYRFYEGVQHADNVIAAGFGLFAWGALIFAA